MGDVLIRRGEGLTYRIQPTGWHSRLTFNSWRHPFPCLFHRFDVVSEIGWCRGFVRRGSAQQYVAEFNVPRVDLGKRMDEVLGPDAPAVVTSPTMPSARAAASLEDHLLRKGSESTASWEGLPDRECGRHSSTGPRAWCSGDSEWCYPQALCRGCQLAPGSGLTQIPTIRLQALEALEGAMAEPDKLRIMARTLNAYDAELTARLEHGIGGEMQVKLRGWADLLAASLATRGGPAAVRQLVGPDSGSLLLEAVSLLLQGVTWTSEDYSERRRDWLIAHGYLAAGDGHGA